jgi:hypothetical protein
MSDESEIFRRKQSCLVEGLSRNLRGRAEENHDNSVGIAGVPSKIRTEHFPNVNIERHRSTNPFIIIIIPLTD